MKSEPRDGWYPSGARGFEAKLMHGSLSDRARQAIRASVEAEFRRLEVSADCRVEFRPPSSNTGVGITAETAKPAQNHSVSSGTIRIHGLHFSAARQVMFDQVEPILRRYFGEFSEDARRGRWGYLLLRQTCSGVFIAHSEDVDHAAACIPGGMCDALDLRDTRLLLAELDAAGVKWTRCDFAFDDHDVIATPSKVYRACRKGSCSGFRTFLYIESTRGGGGSTCELGRRGAMGGGKQLVVYDKGLEAGDGSRRIRWEARYFQEQARAALLCTLGAIDDADFVARLRSLVGGVCSFIKRTDRNVERCEMLPWWKKLRARLGCASWRVNRPLASLAKSLQAIRDQYGPTLASAAVAFRHLGAGDLVEWLKECVDSSVERLSERHRRLVDEYVRCNSDSSDSLRVPVSPEGWHDRQPRQLRSSGRSSVGAFCH